MTEHLENESGYSLVEVLAAIVILTVAIIPMVTMFDTGLRLATTSGNYDEARALANQKLEEAKSLPYATVRTNFPSEASSGKGAPDGGEMTSSDVAVPPSARLPSGSTYTVKKRYVSFPSNPGTSEDFIESDADTKMLRVTVTVNWSGSNNYSASGVVIE